MRRRRVRYNSILYLKQTQNNIFIIGKVKGKLVFSKSSGLLGFQNAKKRTATFTSIQLAQNTSVDFKKNISNALVKVILLSKVNKNTKSFIKNLSYSGVKIVLLREMIPVPHNGLRLKKVRRV